MRLLVVSNFGTTAENPTSGVLIEPRLSGLAAAGHSVTLTVPRMESPLLKVRRAVRKRHARESGPESLPLHVHSDVPTEVTRAPLDLGAIAAFRRGRPQAAASAAARGVITHVVGQTFDAVHGHGLYALPAGGVAAEVAQTLDLPYFITAHGSDINSMPAVQRAYFSQLVSRADGFFTVSGRLRQRALELGLPADDARITPNGIDPRVFHLTRRGQHGRHLRLAYVGTLDDVKGSDRLPAVLASLWRQQPEATLDIVGDGPNQAALQRHFARGHVRFHGWKQQDFVANICSAADVLIIPSRNEGWPCIALEAQACGTPVVGTDAGGIPEAVGTGGEITAAAPFDPESFAAAIFRQASRSDREAISARALNYSWEALGLLEADLIRTGIERWRRRRATAIPRVAGSSESAQTGG